MLNSLTRLRYFWFTKRWELIQCLVLLFQILFSVIYHVWKNGYRYCLATLVMVFASSPVAQIPQCTSLISHNASFYHRNMHMSGHFCYKMVHCGIFVQCIVVYVRRAYGQDSRHFAGDIFKRIFLNEKVRFLTKIHWSLSIKGPIDNNPVLV